MPASRMLYKQYIEDDSQNLPMLIGRFKTTSGHFFCQLPIGSKVMTQNANISVSVFLQFCNKNQICVMFFEFYAFLHVILFLS